MNCTQHLNPISFICIAPHKCQYSRKLCPECLYEHEVDIKQFTIPTKIFQQIALKKLKESKLDDSQELTKQRLNFKTMISQTLNMLKDIWDEMTESIKQIYDLIDLEDISYLNYVNNNVNPVELANTELEKLVQVIIGKQLDDWNIQKISQLKRLEMTKQYWEKETKKFCEILKKEMKEINQLTKRTDNSQENIQQLKEIKQVYNRKEDLYLVLNQTKYLDGSYLNELLYLLGNKKITNCLEFLLNQTELKFIASMIQNIIEIDFNKKNYSTENYNQIRKDLIKQISYDQFIIEFLKFLVRLTAFDERFIQSGSNSLNLLVEMKVDLREQRFENIRIRDTSLVGGSFVRCNFNGSEFDNVDISGMNLNQAQLFNCKWKNIKIHELNKLDGHSDYVNAVCFSPDGITLASGSGDNSIRLWDVKTGQQKAKLDGHSGTVYSICYSPDGTTLASGSGKPRYEQLHFLQKSFDYSIRLWDVKTGQQKAKLDGHSNRVISICYSPDGTTLASGSDDNYIRLWDVKTGQQKAKLNSHSGTVYSVCFSPDGTTLASGSDNYIRLWDVKIKQRQASQILSVCFSPNGTTLATGSNDGSIHIWDVMTGKQKDKLNDHSNSVIQVSFSPDGATLASCSYDKLICLWDVNAQSQIAKLYGHYDWVNSVCFSPDGNKLASGSHDQSICLWDIKTEQQQSIFDGHSDNVRSVCFSPDGTTIASASDDSSICLLDVRTGQLIVKLDGHSNGVNSVCFSPDGTTLASGSYDNSIRLWDVKTGQQKAKLDGHSGTVYSVCFSPDGTTLASGSYDCCIYLWDIQTGQSIAKLDCHLNGVNSVCFSPDGTTLVSGGDDKYISLWDVKTGKIKAKLDCDSITVYSLCFSPDGITLAYLSQDQSFSLWDVQTGQQILPSDDHYKEILQQFKLPIFSNNVLPDSANSLITILQISQNPTLEAQGALILKGQFVDYKGYDLRSLFKSKGSLILENELKQQQN